MSEQSTPRDADPVPDPDDRPRLGPRPLNRPAVDPSLTAAFGRPAGVPSAFAPRPAAGGPGANGVVRLAAPPPEALATAFGRPADAGHVLLQRAPGIGAGALPDEPASQWDDADGHEIGRAHV